MTNIEKYIKLEEQFMKICDKLRNGELVKWITNLKDAWDILTTEEKEEILNKI